MGALLLAAAALTPVPASAQTAPLDLGTDDWKFTAFLYGYFAELKGTVDVGGSSTDIDVPFHTLLDHLKMGFMGALEATKGRWGMFTGVLYMDIGGDTSQVRNFSVNNTAVPVSTDLNLDIKAVVWTLAGQYRAISDARWTVDLLAGARMLYLESTVDYTITGPLGSIQGTRETSGTTWDGIVGTKGRYTFGDNREWFVPFYLDVGTGQSQLTWQGSAGLGYSFRWGDIIAAWRYLDWSGRSGKRVEDLSLNGPMLGVELHW
jgi:hypothetical protein